MDRIILLDGMPNMQRLGSVRIGETVLEQLELDRELEVAAIDRYRQGVALAVEHGDPGTRELLAKLVIGEEGHLDWIDTQLSMIRDIGIELYTQHQIGE
jgi:bacterioferritin